MSNGLGYFSRDEDAPAGTTGTLLHCASKYGRDVRDDISGYPNREVFEGRCYNFDGVLSTEIQILSSNDGTLYVSGIDETGALVGDLSITYDTDRYKITKSSAGKVFNIKIWTVSTSTTSQKKSYSIEPNMWDWLKTEFINQRFSRTVFGNRQVSFSQRPVNFIVNQDRFAFTNEMGYSGYDGKRRMIGDLFSPTFIWSFIKQSDTYTQVVKIRRVSDNDISFFSFTGNDFPTTSVESYLAGSAGRIEQWIDEGGQVAQQLTPSLQPWIALGGSVITRNGFVSLWFNADSYLETTVSTNGEISGNVVGEFDTAAASGAYGVLSSYNAANDGAHLLAYSYSAGAFYGYRVTNTSYISQAYSNEGLVSVSFIKRVGKVDDFFIGENFSVSSVNAANDSPNNTYTMKIGAFGNGGGKMKGYLSEISLYTSDRQDDVYNLISASMDNYKMPYEMKFQRNESSTHLDVYDQKLRFPYRTKKNIALRQSNCIKLNGTDSYISWAGTINRNNFVDDILANNIFTVYLRSSDFTTASTTYIHYYSQMYWGINASGEPFFGCFGSSPVEVSLNAPAGDFTEMYLKVDLTNEEVTLGCDDQMTTFDMTGIYTATADWRLFFDAIGRNAATTLDTDLFCYKACDADVSIEDCRDVTYSTKCIRYLPMAEGGSSILFNAADTGNDYYGGLSNFVPGSDWVKQDLFHYNLLMGCHDDSGNGRTVPAQARNTYQRADGLGACSDPCFKQLHKTETEILLNPHNDPAIFQRTGKDDTYSDTYPFTDLQTVTGVTLEADSMMTGQYSDLKITEA